MKKSKIAFIGRMGSGKTELAKRFTDKFNAVRIALGDALKQDVITYNMTPDGLIDKVRDRSLLQQYGQFRRGENSHVDIHNGSIIGVPLMLEDKKWVEAFMYKEGSSGFSLGSCHSDYWIERLIESSQRILQFEYLVNDDIRRHNEANAFKKLGFTLVMVKSSEENRIQRLVARDGGYNVEHFQDISETESDLIPCDIEIENNGTIESAFDNLLEKIA